MIRKNIMFLVILFVLLSVSPLFADDGHMISPTVELKKVSIYQKAATKGGGKLINTFFDITIKNISNESKQYSVQVVTGKDAMENFFPAKEGQVIEAGEEMTASLSVLKSEFPNDFMLIIEPVN